MRGQFRTESGEGCEKNKPIAKKASKGKKLAGEKELSKAKTLMGIRTLRVNL